jgi:hypothetical protein
MKKFIKAIIFCFILAGAGFSISCDEEDKCDKAASMCKECYSDPSSCLASVDACKVLLPGPPRDDCCSGLIDSMSNCK